MSENSIAQDANIVQKLTPQQREVWQRLRACPNEARNTAGRIPAEYLAGAWPCGTSLPGWKNLLYVTIHNMNTRLAPAGVQIVGYDTRRDPERPGGYTVAEGEAA